ncbi:MAG: hypothetical protein H0V22_06515 [Solirubrobacterales bacterium]|jgi:hypothetical protein|nr:hypothetical protein [Solirubrobacterales bacterium]
MSDVTEANHPPRTASHKKPGSNGAVGSSRESLGDHEGLLTAAVREGATRATLAAGLGAIAAIHAVDAVGKWSETRYLFWMYMAAIVGAIAAAGWSIFTRSRTALLASAGLAGSVLLGYVINRTVGLPNATDDIGNWTEPLGLTSVVVEAGTFLVAIGAYVLSARRSEA